MASTDTLNREARMFWKIISAVATDPGRSMVSVVVRETEASPDIITLGVLVDDPTTERVRAAVQKMVDDHVLGWAEEKARADAIAAAQSDLDKLVGLGSN